MCVFSVRLSCVWVCGFKCVCVYLSVSVGFSVCVFQCVRVCVSVRGFQLVGFVSVGGLSVYVCDSVYVCLIVCSCMFRYVCGFQWASVFQCV